MRAAIAWSASWVVENLNVFDLIYSLRSAATKILQLSLDEVWFYAYTVRGVG